MLLHRRRFLIFAAAASPLLVNRANAAPYPTRPVRLLVGFPAGGTADLLTRIIGEWLQDRLGQPFVIENRPGAATNLATQAVVDAPADGYTLLATTTSNLLNGALYEDMRYDFVRDIAPVAGLTQQPLVFLVTPALPARTVPEFLAYAKANAGKINMGHFGTGTISHLAAEAFKQATGLEFVSVPYRGSAPMIVDLLAGRIHAAFDNIPVSLGHIRSGALRPLAVTSATPSKALADVPTMSDFVPGYEAITVAGIGAPRGTPAEIVETLNREINAALADSRVSARLEEMGSTILGGSSTDFARLIARETDRWAKAIRSSGIKPQ
jgi:tripartite-type tricarboxylate transporter receptor subunit TctC